MIELEYVVVSMMDSQEFDWESCSYFELSEIEDESVRERLIKAYDKEYSKLQKMYPSIEFKFGLSISSLYYSLEEENDFVSTYLFPGDVVYFYPKIEVLTAKISHTCSLSGAVIMPGSEYIVYKAFLYNKSKNESFITPTIVLEIGDAYPLPTTLEEFESFCYRVDHSYEMDLEDEYNLESSLKYPLVRKLNKYKGRQVMSNF